MSGRPTPSRSWAAAPRWWCVVWLVATPLALAKSPPPPPPSTVQVLERNARFWQDKGRPDLARQMWRKILRIDPHHPRALAALGLAPSNQAVAAETPDPPAPKKPSRQTASRARADAKATAAHAAQPKASASAGTLPATSKRKASRPTGVQLASASLLVTEPLQLFDPAPEPPLAPTETTVTPAARRGDRHTVEASSLRIHKPGTPGISDLDWHSQSLRGTWHRDDDRRWIVQIDRYALGAGNSTLAAVQAEGPLGSSDGAPPLGLQPYRTQTHGLAAAVAHESARWRWDLGTTPIGFERPRWTGGVQWTARTEQRQWRLRAHVRPVTSSVLSFAGQRDPVTGQWWGAVDRHAIEGDVRIDTPPSVGWRLQGRLARYEGQDVRRNQERWLQVATAFNLHDTPRQHTEHGPVVEVQQFDNNQNHYSLGHGGYYSPQQRHSLGWLFNHGVSHAQWMWRTRLSLSHSWVRTDAAPVMPLTPGGALYSEGQSTSLGGSAQLSAERVLSERWVVGSALMAERAPDYQFNAWMVYLRWGDERASAPLSVWPSRVFPGLAP